MADLLVYSDWHGARGPRKLGTLSVETVRGRETFSFAFDEARLREGGDVALVDPDLSLFAGRQFPARTNFGFFLDSCPDRWGRRLIRRREALRAAAEGRAPRRLRETDFLLGVYDRTRLGALRFKAAPDGPFLDDDALLPTPPWATLRRLEAAARRLSSDEDAPASDEERWLSLLLAPGSSLGGARPKANVLAPDGSLWIAKFPAKSDEADVGAWEGVAAALARAAGVRAAESRTERLSRGGTTFLSRRFDRDGAARVHFASAMTMLGASDGESGERSYLDIADFLACRGEAPAEDLPELWRRIVLSIAIGNTDDHLRNHGFLLGARGWRLAPAFDLNPNPATQGALSLCIDRDDATADYAVALRVARDFRLSPREADAALARVREAVAPWRSVAASFGIPARQIESYRTAFNP